MLWDLGRWGKREGIEVYLLLIHTVVQQKLTQHCAAIIFQLKFLELAAMWLDQDIKMC